LTLLIPGSEQLGGGDLNRPMHWGVCGDMLYILTSTDTATQPQCDWFTLHTHKPAHTHTCTHTHTHHRQGHTHTPWHFTWSHKTNSERPAQHGRWDTPGQVFPVPSSTIIKTYLDSLIWEHYTQTSQANLGGLTLTLTFFFLYLTFI
jgi:hypothetical protein